MTRLYRGDLAVASSLIALLALAPATTCNAQSPQTGSPNAGSFTSPAAAQSSPYLGQEKRTVKALSDQEIADILAGRGIGFARPAELNHYPGPLHVLQFKDQLGLSADQTDKVQAIFEQMSRDARAIGKEWVDRERALEDRLVRYAITSDQVSAETVAIGQLQGRLRAAHLTAHLATRALLRPDQITKYDSLRGYQATAASPR